MQHMLDGKKVLCLIPGGLLDKMDALAVREHRTRADLMREAFRQYVERKEKADGNIDLDAALSIERHPASRVTRTGMPANNPSANTSPRIVYEGVPAERADKLPGVDWYQG